MSSEFVDAITHGIGVALSPLVIIALVMILLSPRAKANSLGFLAGWVLGLAVLGAIIFALGGFSGLGDRHKLKGIINLVFGGLLLALALRSWLQRKTQRSSPAWLSAVDTFTFVEAAVAGCFFSSVYPKNLLLTAAAASELAVSGGEHAVAAYLLFMAIGSTTIAGPVLICLVAGKRMTPFLGRAKDELTARSQQILRLLLTFFGAKLVIQGVVLLAGW